MVGALKVKVGGEYVALTRGPKGEPGAAVIVERPVTDLPNTYPEGISIFNATTGAWPATTGMVITHMSGGVGTQLFFGQPGAYWTRSAQSGGTAWSSWFAAGNVVRVFYDTVAGAYPTRPVGAAFVEWVGPGVTPLAAQVQPGDTYINTTG